MSTTTSRHQNEAELSGAEVAPAAPLAERLPQSTPAGRARAGALAAGREMTTSPPEAVTYDSQGRLLIIGTAPQVGQVVPALAERLTCTALVTWPDATAGNTAPGADILASVETVPGIPATVDGHLGAFRVMLQTETDAVEFGAWLHSAPRTFDLVLDLQHEPCLRRQVPPPGYFAPMGDAAALEATLDELPDLVGEFQKARFFDYDPALCAHGRSGLTGCTRCLDTCPTLAITSLGDRVEIDPYLCQGAGSCSAVCPTGAIRYAAPPVAELRAIVRTLLRRYLEATPDERPALLFHDREGGSEQLARVADSLPQWVLPWPVEEIGAVGYDLLLSALAHGARGVYLLAGAATPDSVNAALRTDCAMVTRIVAALGYGDGRVGLLEAPDDDGLSAALAAAPAAAWTPAQFSAADEKRTALRLALDHLYAQAATPVAEIELPAGSPFGEVRVDRAACTLCMACTGACPTSALVPGDGSPRLDFIEWNCIQCGLCQRTCPEDAVTLVPRLLLDPERRAGQRMLHEDQPFHCVRCGKVFATHSVMARLAEKLEGHWMFQTDDARKRLQMCEDCRVQDMFEKEPAGVPSQRPSDGT